LIYYLDTSALAKRYVRERDSARVRALLRREKRIGVSRIAYAEVAAAVCRRTREGLLPEDSRDRILERLDGDFANLLVVEVRARIVRRAAELAVRHPLRGYDSVHLASALALREEGLATDFWSTDGRLVAAARAEGLRSTPLA
jgi:predicted nucleic acid-binding protein